MVISHPAALPAGGDGAQLLQDGSPAGPGAGSMHTHTTGTTTHLGEEPLYGPGRMGSGPFPQSVHLLVGRVPGSDLSSEEMMGPALIGQDDGNEDQGHHQHDAEGKGTR